MLPFFFFCEKERQIRKHTYICLDLQNNNSNKKEKPENNEAGCLQGMEVGEENEKDTGENDTSLSTPFLYSFPFWKHGCFTSSKNLNAVNMNGKSGV